MVHCSLHLNGEYGKNLLDLIYKKTLCILWGITVSSLFITSLLNFLVWQKQIEHFSIITKSLCSIKNENIGAEIIVKLGALYKKKIKFQASLH